MTILVAKILELIIFYIMNPGKVTCEELKKIRKMIADKNNIPYEITECKFSGKCSGTCPFCESEVKYLETQLSKRKSLGKKVLLTGVAVGLSVFSQAQDVQQIDTVEIEKQQVVNTINKMTVHGTVLDENDEPLPGVTIIESGTTNGTISDLDGKFEISVTHDMLEISCIGYKTQKVEVAENITVVLEEDDYLLEGDIVVGGVVEKIPEFNSVDGEVVDDYGMPIFGVKVSEIGTLNRMMLYENNFHFKMEDVHHKLEFTASGYYPVILKSSQQKMRVVMRRNWN